jgi:hypothetical protein
MITLRRVGVFSLGKVFGVLYGLFGLLGGVFMTGISLLGMIFSGASQSAYSSYTSFGGNSDITGIITGLGAVICLPLLYGVLGFIGGIITAFFCNLALKWAGGLELELDGVSIQPPSAKDAPLPRIESIVPPSQ